jgi:hypothetical protein
MDICLASALSQEATLRTSESPMVVPVEKSPVRPIADTCLV